MYYYGARYYDPRLSIFMFVDPLAEQFMGWTPYHYVHQNPINLIDPTGMSADGWRKNLQTGEMSYDESFTFDNTDDNLYEYGDAFINEGGYDYFSDGTVDINLEYMYDLVFGPSRDYKSNKSLSCLGRGSGNADISKLHGNAVDALKYDLPEGLQNFGDMLQIGGWTMASSGVAAKPGMAIAGLGNVLSLGGAGLETVVLYSDGNKKEAITKLIITGTFIGFGNLAVKGTRKVAGDEFVKQGLNNTSEAVIQGMNMGMEKTIGNEV